MDKKINHYQKNQKIVLDFIQKNKKPVKAYSILSNVQKKGINAPPQVYRALDNLIGVGKIHKVDKSNIHTRLVIFLIVKHLMLLHFQFVTVVN